MDRKRGQTDPENYGDVYDSYVPEMEKNDSTVERGYGEDTIQKSIFAILDQKECTDFLDSYMYRTNAMAKIDAKSPPTADTPKKDLMSSIFNFQAQDANSTPLPSNLTLDNITPPKYVDEKPQGENGHRTPEAPQQRVKTITTPSEEGHAMKVANSQVMQ